MKFLSIFVLIIVLGTYADCIPDLPDDPDLTNFVEKYGSGICNEEKFEQLNIQEQNCMEQADFYNTSALIYHDWNINEWCTHLENVLKCFYNYTECYSYDQMKKLNTTIIEWTVEPLSWLGHGLFGTISGCPIYLQLTDNGSSLEWNDWLIVAIIAVLVAIFVAIVFKTISKDNMKKEKDEDEIEQARR